MFTLTILALAACDPDPCDTSDDSSITSETSSSDDSSDDSETSSSDDSSITSDTSSSDDSSITSDTSASDDSSVTCNDFVTCKAGDGSVLVCSPYACDAFTQQCACDLNGEPFSCYADNCP